MKVTFTRLASLLLCSFFAVPAYAEHDGAPLVPSIGPTMRPDSIAPECKLKDQLEGDLVLQESEKAVTKMLLGVTVLHSKYQAIRDAGAMRDIPVTEGSSASFIKQLVKYHDGYMHSSEKISGGSLSAAIPPAALFILGANLYTDSSAKTPLPTAKDRRLGILAMLGGSLSASVVYSGKGSLVNSLAYGAGELSLNEQKAIQNQLEEGMSEPVKLLGETLGWNAQHKAQFSRALRKKVIETFEFSVRPGSRNSRAALVANLAKIDFSDLLLKENLISSEELSALQTIEKLKEQGAKLKAEMTPKQLKEILNQDSGPQSNVYALGRLHRLLLTVQKELPADGAEGAKAELAALIEQSAKSIETLKKLCEVGLE